MLNSDILETIAGDVERHIGGEWKHEVNIYGASHKHINFEIDRIEYVLVLHKVEEGHHWSEYITKEKENERPTNFDKVTASPEKLVEFVADTMFHTSGCRYTGKLKCPNTTCKECVLEWIKQKAEDKE